MYSDGVWIGQFISYPKEGESYNSKMKEIQIKDTKTQKSIKMNKARWGDIADRYDWKTLQNAHDDGMNLQTLYKTYKVSRKAVDNGRAAGLFIKRDVKACSTKKEEDCGNSTYNYNVCPRCNNYKYARANNCNKCEQQIRINLGQNKSKCPSKEELYKLVWDKPNTEIAKEFDVSNVAVAKWCKKLGVAGPPMGYWAKRNAGMSHDEALCL